jgi:integrase
MQSRITEGLVRKLLADPPGKDTSIFDTETRRFAFRVKPRKSAGAKPAAWFFVRYTAPDGSECRQKVGDPRTNSVEEARKAGKRVLALVDTGRDPRQEQRRRRATPTMEQLARDYLASEVFARKTDKVKANDRARIASHIIPRIGSAKADAVTIDMARRLYRQIANDTRTNRRKRRLGGPGAARKTLRLTATMLGWAKSETLIQAVPFNLRELELGGDGTRDAVITSADEYARLFATMAEMVIAGSLRPEAEAIFVLIASTGLRRGEAQALHWGQVNLGRRQITLRDTKGVRLARKRSTDQAGLEVVGLPPIAAVALAAIMPDSAAADALVFPPVRGQRLAVARDWIRVRKAAGMPENLTLHGLRHSVGTVGALAGLSMPELQALLRHRQPGTTARYIHLARMAGGLADKAMAGVLPAPDSPRRRCCRCNGGSGNDETSRIPGHRGRSTAEVRGHRARANRSARHHDGRARVASGRCDCAHPI